MRFGLLAEAVEWCLRVIVGRVVKDPLAAGEFREIKSADYRGVAPRQFVITVTPEAFREWVAEVDGELERPFRDGQRSQLMKNLAEADKEGESFHATVKYQGRGSTIDIKTWGRDGSLVVAVRGAGPAMEFLEQGLESRKLDFKNGVELRQCKVGTSEYDDLLDLRFRELRMPLGLKWSAKDLQWEQLEQHYGFYLGGILVGVCVVRNQRGTSVKVRQIAIAAEYQRQRFGTMMMLNLLSILRKEGVTQVELNSRANVIGFYEELGFLCDGEEFEEIGLAHQKMVAKLSPHS